jgi:hypothetical protein
MSRPAAWREFVKLCPSDQECAIRQAARYASDCKRDGIQFPRHAATWLHDREFTGSEAKAQTVELSKALGGVDEFDQAKAGGEADD